jgi:hypothetical protein
VGGCLEEGVVLLVSNLCVKIWSSLNYEREMVCFLCFYTSSLYTFIFIYLKGVPPPHLSCVSDIMSMHLCLSSDKMHYYEKSVTDEASTVLRLLLLLCPQNTSEKLTPLIPKELEVMVEYKDPSVDTTKAGKKTTKNDPTEECVEFFIFDEEKYEEHEEKNAMLIEMGWKINGIPYLSKGMLDNLPGGDSKRRSVLGI